ncbi:MAG: ABC transporter ATP-binding protein [Microbacterium sp.]
MTSTTGLQLSEITASYQGHTAIEGISLAAAPGETVAVIGPSGCGKSTTLRCAAGLQPIDAGRIEIGARDVSRLAPARRGIGFVPQSYAVFPHMSVRANIGYGLRARRVSATARERRIDEVLRLTALGEFAARRPDQLSGGQRQRVALARALAVEPEVLLLDEPLAALDPQLRSDIRRELSLLLADAGCATLLVTHDQREALTLGHRIAVLREGRVVQFGTASLLWNDPADAFVADFLASSALLDAHVGHDDVDVLDGRWRIPRSLLAPRESARSSPAVLLRDDALRVVPAGGEAPGAVDAELLHREFQGDDVRLTVRVADTHLRLRAGVDEPIGSRLRLAPVPGRAALLLPTR